jgi:uncharacterized protein (DUF427 family)
MTVQAKWNEAVIAESDSTVLVEGNHYFPPDDVRFDLLDTGELTTHCTWKGDASYYHVIANGRRNEDAAWYYPEPYGVAARIKDYIAFWKGVQVEGSNPDEPEILPWPRQLTVDP